MALNLGKLVALIAILVVLLSHPFLGYKVKKIGKEVGEYVPTPLISVATYAGQKVGVLEPPKTVFGAIYSHLVGIPSTVLGSVSAIPKRLLNTGIDRLAVWLVDFLLASIAIYSGVYFLRKK